MKEASLGKLTLLVQAMAIVVGLAAPHSLQAQNREPVGVISVEDQTAIVLRRSGDRYALEYGVGCLSLWRMEGKVVRIEYNTIFAGVGSKIVIDEDQQCRIWNAELLSATPDRRQYESTPSRPSQNTLYDGTGEAVAWIDAGDGTVFLWNGSPAAYVDGNSIYGFNGDHLGWYQGGVIYDADGRVVAAPESALALPVQPAPPRGVRQLKPLKGLKELRPLRPLLRMTWSRIPAEVFLMQGRR